MARAGAWRSFVDVARVKMEDPGPGALERFLASGAWKGKAGAYDIEERRARQPPLGVARLPPAFKQAVGEGVREGDARHLEQREEPARPQEAADQPQGVVQPSGAGEGIRGHDDG
ncbi:MAG: hypothetical protein ACO276_08720, partial [Ilumatobacteraceae bacterium]